MPKLIPEVFNGVEVRTAGRPFNPLHSQILEVVSDKPRSEGTNVVILEERDCGDMGLPLVAESHLDVSALSLPPMMTCLVFPVREMPPHTITLSPPKDVMLLVQQSA